MVSGQTVRRAVKAALEADGVLPTGWRVVLDTSPPKHARTLQVGHAERITPDAYRAYAMVLVLTLWVDEADSNAAVDELYALLSPGPQSILAALLRASTFELAGQIDAGDIGPREQASTTFLAADIRLPVIVPMEAS